MSKESVQFERSRVTLTNPDAGAPGPCGLRLDSVRVEGVFESPDARPAPRAEGEPAPATAGRRRPPLVEFSITSRRLVLYKRKP